MDIPEIDRHIAELIDIKADIDALLIRFREERKRLVAKRNLEETRRTTNGQTM